MKNALSLDKWLEIAALSMFAILLGFSIYLYFNLPETIATHFNAVGKADAYGPKSTVFILPGIYLFLQLLLSSISLSSDLLNTPVEITAENQERQIELGRRFLLVLRIVVGFIFLSIEYAAYGLGDKIDDDLTIWLLPLIILLLAIPIVGYIVLARRAR
ncbi:DUF1648 domain-containing protein [Flavobacterium aurantiibacter]|uniref:DUF1648 domain-containing protein n=1 Tax=Flavobacterium aurantiibacter TaxID=2023067 RepID=A0A255ZPA6_9FLAO|nr:DUF1648 domain-containing protein [Flavobacterium aurantiibacter]OYQ43232.1 hypothetical protein CHX27_10880 [Flavobacterium aurantiibacter]